MKKYEVRIPRAVRMTEWETIVVEASNEVDALDYALRYEKCNWRLSMGRRRSRNH